MYQIKRDKFQAARGGSSRILDIKCEHCLSHICFYQKDGPGSLRRMYVDRMIDLAPDGDRLICHACHRELGVKVTWQKENRPAYRLFVESVNKFRTSRNSL
jgi:hypothetical protein